MPLIQGFCILNIVDLLTASFRILHTNITTYFNLSWENPSISNYFKSSSLDKMGLLHPTVSAPRNAPMLMRHILMGLI